jgi:hypothetical protein
MFSLNSYAAQIKPLKFALTNFPARLEHTFLCLCRCFEHTDTKMANNETETGNETIGFYIYIYKTLSTSKILIEL